ncbi:MAG: helix-turn-helix transcriptional regulator, partial [Nanoarchaeota archaeon]|nr:helix-turn-helix transcriptional regulator [Nanoarchaeota archaeon]
MKIRSDARDPYFNYKLREACQNKEYTAIYVASAVGISSASINHYERLRRMPTPKIAEDISVLLDRPVEELFPPYLGNHIKDIRKERKEDFNPLNHAVPLGLEAKNLIDQKGISPVDVAILWEKTAAIRHVVNGLESR